ncbi:MAG: c-type cytochrome, partial [Thiotrichaceae bacterium]|nr:c-type cytochrome [Thiotrichaceae bacterium]
APAEEVKTNEGTPAEVVKIDEAAPAEEAKTEEVTFSTGAPVKPEAPIAKPKPVAPTAPTITTETVAEKVEETEAKEATTEKAEVAVVASGDNKEGEKLYKKTCFACHDTGVASSPILGDAAVWAPRIAAGKEVLYSTAINGKGAMPPKGGNASLSDEEVKAVVDYMISKAQSVVK